MQVYLNGTILPLEEARISPMDRGFIYGDGVYEGVSAYDGKIFRLEDHVQRLNRGLAFLGIEDHFATTNWQVIFEDLLQANDALKGAWFIYQQITTGYQEVRNHVRPEVMQPTVFIALKPFLPAKTKADLRPVKAITTPDIRWQRCDLKCTSLLGNVDAYNKADRAGASQALLIKDGFVTEAAANNFFIVKNGTVITAPLSRDLLPGITRKVLVEIFEKYGIAFKEENITLDALYDADEVFATGSTSEISPIVSVDDRQISNGQIGPLSYHIFELFLQAKA